MCKGPEVHRVRCGEQQRNQWGWSKGTAGRGIFRTHGWTFCLDPPDTENSPFSLRLLIDVGKNVNFMESQSELAQQRNNSGGQMGAL
jgi:hypothetical protein